MSNEQTFLTLIDAFLKFMNKEKKALFSNDIKQLSPGEDINNKEYHISIGTPGKDHFIDSNKLQTSGGVLFLIPGKGRDEITIHNSHTFIVTTIDDIDNIKVKGTGTANFFIVGDLLNFTRDDLKRKFEKVPNIGNTLLLQNLP